MTKQLCLLILTCLGISNCSSAQNSLIASHTKRKKVFNIPLERITFIETKKYSFPSTRVLSVSDSSLMVNGLCINSCCTCDTISRDTTVSLSLSQIEVITFCPKNRAGDNCHPHPGTMKFLSYAAGFGVYIAFLLPNYPTELTSYTGFLVGMGLGGFTGEKVYRKNFPRTLVIKQQSSQYKHGWQLQPGKEFHESD